VTDVRLALLNAAHAGEQTRRNFEREVPAELVNFDVTGGEFPDTLAFDGCLITGSRASVYWDREWIGNLKTWVGSAIRQGMPHLGVCFGHQLLAEVLGGAVENMGEYEIGYRTVEHEGTSLLFEGIDRDFTVFTTHSDRVTRLPPGARLLAKNDYGIHGFRQGAVFAVQFHPEYDRAMAERVTRGKDELPEQKVERVFDGITDENIAAASEATTVFENFLAFVEGHQPLERAESI
jgi:GMP synthase (glutamine-hydrolysing)